MAQLTVKYTQPEDIKAQAYHLKTEVTAAQGMSNAIFVFRAKVLSATNDEHNQTDDCFECVASALDLEKYAENTPRPQDGIFCYRLPSVELVFTSVQDRDEVKTLISEAVTQLVDSINRLSDIQVEEEVVYGG